jgi:ankyrin repeat protein
VQILLEHHNTNPNHCDKEGWTPLLIAANEGHDVVVQLLLGHHSTMAPNLAASQHQLIGAGGEDHRQVPFLSHRERLI